MFSYFDPYFHHNQTTNQMYLLNMLTSFLHFYYSLNCFCFFILEH